MQSIVNNTKNDKLLTDLLKKNGWDVNSAMEEYFSKGYGETASAASGASGSAGKIQQTFDRYKDSGSGNIEIEGL